VMKMETVILKGLVVGQIAETVLLLLQDNVLETTMRYAGRMVSILMNAELLQLAE
jgi:hypothetical protein